MTPIYVECWFIGGPWNNRLVAVPIVTYRRGAPPPTGVPVFECLWGPY